MSQTQQTGIYWDTREKFLVFVVHSVVERPEQRRKPLPNVDPKDSAASVGQEILYKGLE